MMRRSRDDQDIQGQGGQTHSMAGRSVFLERRVQLAQSWKEEGFEYLDHALLMYEMMDPSTSKSLRLACAVSLDNIQSIKDQL